MPKKRKLPEVKYKNFRLSKRIKHPKPPISGSFQLFWRSLTALKINWKVFGGISLIYLILTVVVVKGLTISSGITDIKPYLEEVFKGSSRVGTSLALFTVLLSNINTSAGEAANVYQAVFFLIFSLAIVWVLRRQMSKSREKILIRDAFYKGLYPITPFFIILLIIGLELLPIFLAGGLYSLVVAGGLATTGLEQFLWLIILFLMSLLSLYLVSSSLIALYVTTLPDISPLKALRSARELVKNRRWMIMRKVFALPIILLVISAAFVVPVIIIWPAGAEWLFLALVILALPVAHSYLYNLYRELL